MSREAIGEIACPLCKRDAELHAFHERQKVSTEGGKPAYPRKFFVVCPPVRGYRGCGTILCNGPEAQARLMELARVFGPSDKPARTEPDHPAPSPAPATKARNPFRLW